MPHIITGHMWLAMVVGPEIMIGEPEALTLARCWIGWRQHYPPLIGDPKTASLLALLGALAVIEAPRLTRAAARKKAERKGAEVTRAAQAQAGSPNIVQMAGI